MIEEIGNNKIYSEHIYGYDRERVGSDNIVWHEGIFSSQELYPKPKIDFNAYTGSIYPDAASNGSPTLKADERSSAVERDDAPMAQQASLGISVSDVYGFGAYANTSYTHYKNNMANNFDTTLGFSYSTSLTDRLSVMGGVDFTHSYSIEQKKHGNFIKTFSLGVGYQLTDNSQITASVNRSYMAHYKSEPYVNIGFNMTF